MKKVMILAAAIALTGMTSCKKDYECTCTASVVLSHQSSSNEYTSHLEQRSTTFEDTKEEEADEDCQNYGTQYEGDIESGEVKIKLNNGEFYTKDELENFGYYDKIEPNVNCTSSEMD